MLERGENKLAWNWKPGKENAGRLLPIEPVQFSQGSLGNTTRFSPRQVEVEVIKRKGRTLIGQSEANGSGLGPLTTMRLSPYQGPGTVCSAAAVATDNFSSKSLVREHVLFGLPPSS